MHHDSQSTDEAQRWMAWAREHGPAVRGYVLALVRRTELAEELTQEVFYRAWRARRSYREEGNARAYLLRIADRLVCDVGRKAGREVTLDEEGWRQIEPVSRTAGPLQSLQQAEAARQLAAALDSLSPAQRRVLLLRYYGQLSFAEIAEIVNCPINTALSHCRRGLSTMRRILVESAL